MLFAVCESVNSLKEGSCNFKRLRLLSWERIGCFIILFDSLQVSFDACEQVKLQAFLP
jgi:hypothetical protein